MPLQNVPLQMRRLDHVSGYLIGFISFFFYFIEGIFTHGMYNTIFNSAISPGYLSAVIYAAFVELRPTTKLQLRKLNIW